MSVVEKFYVRKVAARLMFPKNLPTRDTRSRHERRHAGGGLRFPTIEFVIR